MNVRLIAATHRDLAAMVHQGKFREDLWYRVNVLPLLLPRLAERPEAIPALARHLRSERRIGLASVISIQPPTTFGCLPGTLGQAIFASLVP